MRKAKFNIIDMLVLFIVVVVIFVGVSLLNLGVDDITADEVRMEVVAEVTGVRENLVDSIKLGEVYLTVDNVDTAIVTDVKKSIYQETIYNPQTKVYELMDSVDSLFDAVVTLELDAVETETDFISGMTKIKVGLPIFIKGKGYSTKGYILEMRVLEGGVVIE